MSKVASRFKLGDRHQGTPWECCKCHDVCNVLIESACCAKPTPSFRVTNGWESIGPSLWEFTGKDDGRATDPIDDPREAEYWWNIHTRMVRDGRMEKPFARNPNDIDQALSMEDGHHKLWLDCWESAIKFEPHGIQSVVQAFTNKYIARLMDAGTLVRPGSAKL